jgi:MFS family permease
MSGPAVSSPAADYAPFATRWYVVFALSFASIVSYVDRQIINLLVDPIKVDLGLSDVQISLLQGFSFALLYASLAIPIAWFSDRSNRKWVILTGLVFWSAATFGTGLATSFAALFIARMCVGVGEATLAPAGFSLLSDYFRRAGLPAAISVFTGSGYLGSGLALVIGGYVITQLEDIGTVTLAFGTFKPWQLAFLAVTLLSIPAFLLLLFIREPQRRETDAGFATGDTSSIPETIRFLWARAKIFVPLFLGLSCFAAAQFGIGAWTPSLFLRVHGWTQMQVGELFGPVVMFCGLAGVVTGGWVAKIAMARGVVDATLRVPLAAVAIALIPAIAFPLVSSPFSALALVGLVMFFGSMPGGAGVSSFPLITPNRMRAQVVAIYLLVANLLGYSAGPLFVAWLTDNAFGAPELLWKSLAIAPPLMMLLGLVLVFLALKPFRLIVDDTRAD